MVGVVSLGLMEVHQPGVSVAEDWIGVSVLGDSQSGGGLPCFM